MTSQVLTAAVIARESLMILENDSGMVNRVYRGYEKEFDQTVNGYKKGATITIRKPAQYNLRVGPVMTAQDTLEPSIPFTVNQQVGVDFDFSSTDLTLSIDQLSERVLRPAMVKIADAIDLACYEQFTGINNWVGTPGNVMSNLDSFLAATERMDNGAVPQENRFGVLSPRDVRGMLASIAGPSSIFDQKAVSEAYRKGKLGMVDGTDVFKAQNVAFLATGTRTNGTNNSTVPTTIQASLATGTQTMSLTGLGANATIAAGEIFTFAGVYDVNPVNFATQTYLKQFTVTAAAVASAGGVASVTVYPAMILTGPFQNISAAPASNAVVTWAGTASTTYRQNLIAHKNAIGLVIVPMERPEGAVKCSRMSHNGISVRVIPVYDGYNDNNLWRLDVLFGVQMIDGRLACRVSGT